MNDYDTYNILQLFSRPRTWTLKIEKMYRCAMLVGSVTLFCFGALHVRIGIGHPKKTPFAASMIRSLGPAKKKETHDRFLEPVFSDGIPCRWRGVYIVHGF
jgi:hypothetical protein